MPSAGVWRALMKRSVSQGARSPISTCLLCSRGGTGFTLQSGSLLIYALLSRKSGSSPDRSMWAFLDTRSRRTLARCNRMVHTKKCCFLYKYIYFQLSHLINLLVKCGDQFMEEVERVRGEKCLILCSQARRSRRQLHGNWTFIKMISGQTWIKQNI